MDRDLIFNALQTELTDFSGEISEIELIRRLQQPPWQLFPADIFTDDHLLFQVHFALYNACYRLRDCWIEQQRGKIEIALSRIRCIPQNDEIAADSESNAVTAHDPLRDYYLDWQNFSTDKADVENMLSSFWKKFAAWANMPERLAQSYSVLGVNESDPLTEIKQQYRKLAAQHHPDKGGDAAQFKAVQAAWQAIRLAHSER